MANLRTLAEVTAVGAATVVPAPAAAAAFSQTILVKFQVVPASHLQFGAVFFLSKHSVQDLSH